MVLTLGLLGTILALFSPEARLVLGAALWIVGLPFATLAFIGGVMWILARLNGSGSMPSVESEDA